MKKTMKKVEISHRTIVFTVLFLISLFLLYQIRQVLTVFFVSLILMFALNPSVLRLESFRVPRVLAILFIYLLVFGTLGLVIAGVIPPLVDQTTILINRLPIYVQSLGLPSFDHNFLANQFSQLGSLPASVLKVTVSLFNNLLAIFILAVLTFYLLMERKKLDRYLLFLFGPDGEKKAKVFVDELEKRLGGWVRAQIALMVIIGLMSYFGLRLLGIEFALPLALLAGVLEIIPNVGPTLSAIPAVLAGLAISPLMGLAVLALYFLIQQLENALIVPQIMSKEVGINPLLALLSLIIGFELGGVVGMILAIPVVLLGQVIASEIFASKRFQEI
jgi:predicted PurR-regulated permease PerM